MKLLIAYLFFALVLGLRAGRRPDGELARWPLAAGALVLGVGYLSLRVILE
jgi:hypothetical protein